METLEHLYNMEDKTTTLHKQRQDSNQVLL